MGLSKSTFKHTAIYSFAAMLGKAIGFFMLPFYAHIFGAIGYGVVGLIDVSLSFLMSLLARGVAGALARFYHEEEGQNKNLVISTGIWLIGGAALLLVLVAVLFSKPICSLLLGDSSHYVLLCLGLGSFWFDLVGQAAGVILVIQRRSVSFSAVGLLRLIIGLSLNIYLIIILKLGLLGYFLSGLLTTIIPAVIFLTIAYRQCGAGYDRRIARKIIAYQLPLIPGSLASFISRQVERILIRFMISIQSVGILEMGYKFPILMNLLVTFPFFRSWDTKRIEIAQTGSPEAPRQIGQLFTYGMFLLISVGLVIAVGIRDLLHLMTPPEFWAAERIAQVEVLTLIFFGARFHVNFGLFFMKDTKTWAFILASTSFMKVALSFLFISLWGLEGAVYSACLVEFGRLIWGGWRGQQLYRIDIEYKKLIGMMAYAFTIFMVLTRLDLQNSELVKIIADQKIPSMLTHLEGTFVFSLRDGALVRVLEERSDILVSFIFRTLLCLSFGLFFPYVYRPSGQRFFGFLGKKNNKTEIEE